MIINEQRIENCSPAGTIVRSAGSKWNYTKAKNLGNLRAFGTLLMGFTENIYKPLDRWTNITPCLEAKGKKAYRFGVVNVDRSWSILNRVDNHFYVFAYILNVLDSLGLNVVYNNKVDIDLLREALTTGQVTTEEEVVSDIPNLSPEEMEASGQYMRPEDRVISQQIERESKTIKTPTYKDFFSEDGKYYSDILCMIQHTTKDGDAREDEALTYLQDISTKGGEWIGTCHGDKGDVKNGIDLTQIIDGIPQGFQVKPFRGVGETVNGDYVVTEVGNSKVYPQPPRGPEFYVFVGNGGELDGEKLVFKNEGVESGSDRQSYIFPKSSFIRTTIVNEDKKILKPLIEYYVFKNTMLI